MDGAIDATSSSLPYVVGVSVAAVIVINLTLRVFQSGFKRSVHTSFSNVIGGTSILSNPDSVLKPGGVEDSIAGYEKLYSGARKETGNITSDESIKMRQEEYKTMVNSFYDLVTDFYEWGWGQVRPISV